MRYDSFSREKKVSDKIYVSNTVREYIFLEVRNIEQIGGICGCKLVIRKVRHACSIQTCLPSVTRIRRVTRTLVTLYHIWSRHRLLIACRRVTLIPMDVRSQLTKINWRIFFYHDLFNRESGFLKILGAIRLALLLPGWSSGSPVALPRQYGDVLGEITWTVM